MTFGIITFHFPYNCGAVLQCLALQTKLSQMGHDVEIINYRPWYHQNRYVALKNPVYYGMKRFNVSDDNPTLIRRISRGGKGFLLSVYSWRNYKKLAPRHHKFENFIQKQLNQTKVYRTLQALQANPPKRDVYIAGSDQLWNRKITEGNFDAAYFLKFGDQSVKRMTYAMGANFPDTRTLDTLLSTLVSDFDAISLREKKCYTSLSRVWDKGDILFHLDPTFLLDAEEYDRFYTGAKLETAPFILTYTMPNQSQAKVFNGARLLSEKLGIKVIDISGNPSMANKKIADNRVCGPDEFLWYMKNAAYVLTNSFHGTAFSVIYRKQFAVIPHTETGNRVVDTLAQLDLSARAVTTSAEAITLVQQPVSYESAEKQIKKLQDESIRYLTSCQ